MRGLAEAFARRQLIGEEEPDGSLGSIASPAASPIASACYDEQICALVQQLFFPVPGSQPCRVGFASADPQTDIAQFCLSVARVLAGEGRHDVGLIDAAARSAPLRYGMGEPERVHDPAFSSERQSQSYRGLRAWQLEKRLWLVPREKWLKDEESPALSAAGLTRLRDLTLQFDFSVLYCGPVSVATARVGRACDGLVLVLTAGKTRRLVAEKMKEELRVAGVPLLGTVLSARRFPVPTALYRKL